MAFLYPEWHFYIQNGISITILSCNFNTKFYIGTSQIEIKPCQIKVGGDGIHKMAACISCKHERQARTIDKETKLCKMCILKVKQGRPLVNQAGSSEQSISNGGDNDNKNDYHNYGEEFSVDDSVSQIGEKRTRKEADLKVEEDDLGEYQNKSSTGTEDVFMVNMCTSKGT